MFCKICNFKAKSNQQLVKHIAYKHNLKAKEYYDQYLKSPTEGSCVVCSSPTTWQALSTGYSKCCPSRKCSGTYHRKELKKNPKKLQQFKDKVSKNMEDIWEQRESTGEKQIITKKAGATIVENNKLLTPEELKQRYGWMNKLPPKEKSKKVKEILDKSLRKWWKEASNSRKEQLYSDRLLTRIKNGTATDPDLITEKEAYYRIVRLLTAETYRKYKEKINPNNLPHGRGNSGYQLDHKFSISQGFKHDIPPKIMASLVNLEMLPSHINNSKNYKCSITKEKLLEDYYGNESAIG